MEELYENNGARLKEVNRTSEEITEDEILYAIKTIKNNKATGSDNIPIEFIRHANEATKQEVISLVRRIYAGEHIPKDWLHSIFVAIPKKKNANECQHFRTIALITHGMKILTRVLFNRIAENLTNKIDPSQYGFRRGMGTLEAVACMKAILASRINMKKKTYLCFIDFTKAFDRVDHTLLLNILHERGVPEREIELLTEIYSNQEGHMKDDDAKQYPIRIGRGVRQGCVLSPILYNTYADHAFKNISPEIGIEDANGRKQNRITYADDTVLIADNLKDLQTLTQEMVRLGEPYGIDINTTKTKVMVVQREGTEELKLKINGSNIEKVENFTYLGIRINENMKHDKDIRMGIERARIAFWKHKELFRHNLSLRCKRILLHTQVFSILRYCSEAFTLTKCLKKKINAFEMWCYRRTLKIPWTDRISNDQVLERMGMNKLVLMDKILERKCMYIGHIARGSAGAQLKEWCYDERKTGKGRKRRHWRDDVDMIGEGRTFSEKTSAAQNRLEWSMKVREKFPRQN